MPGYTLIPGPTRYRNPFGMADERRDLCATYLEHQILHEGSDYVAAFIGEPIMQAHGVQIRGCTFLAGTGDCDRYGVLLIADEVITGFGRTGDGSPGSILASNLTS